jgi:hypothetical protein
MRRLALTVTVVAMAGVVAMGPAWASQCPKLVEQINRETSNRLDAASYAAKQKADEATKLHAEGKHAEAEKAAKEGLALIGK